MPAVQGQDVFRPLAPAALGDEPTRGYDLVRQTLQGILGEADFERLIRVRGEAVAALKAAGFSFVAIDLEPFRSGRLNEAAGLVPLRR